MHVRVRVRVHLRWGYRRGGADQLHLLFFACMHQGCTWSLPAVRTASATCGVEDSVERAESGLGLG